jgi:hypothetical protein
MELAANPIAPRVVHPQHIDMLDRKFEVGTLELPMQDLPFLRELLGIGEVLQLAAAAAGFEIGTGRIDARGRRLEDGRRLGAPKIFPPVGDFGFNGFSRDRSLDEDDPAVDSRQGGPAVGELANGQLH